MAIPPSGEQYEIRWADQRATVVEVGGGIREYTSGDRPVLNPYPVESMCDGAHGAPLIPWPNRLGDGKYHFDGSDYQVALTEPEQHNAIHGFLRWRAWRAIERTESRVVMGIVLHPLAGYPFTLDVQIAYQLDDSGLTVRTTAANRGERALPFGAGQHPYLSAGGGPVDDCVLQLDAATRILTGDRQLPAGTEPVHGGDFDFRTGRAIGEQQIDFAFTGLARDTDGRAWVRLTGPDGQQVALWLDEHYPYVEIYTGDTLSAPRRRLGLGTEPMTCPPNAFQSGDDIVRLEPGESFSAAWGVGLLPASNG